MWNNLKNLLTLKYVKVLGGLLVQTRSITNMPSKIPVAIENKLLEYVGKL